MAHGLQRDTSGPFPWRLSMVLGEDMPAAARHPLAPGLIGAKLYFILAAVFIVTTLLIVDARLMVVTTLNSALLITALAAVQVAALLIGAMVAGAILLLMTVALLICRFFGGFLVARAVTLRERDRTAG